MIDLHSFEVPPVVKHGLEAIKAVADEVKGVGIKRQSDSIY